MVEWTASNPILKILIKLPHHPVASASARNEEEEDTQSCMPVVASAILEKKSGDTDNCVVDVFAVIGETNTRGVTQAFAFQAHSSERPTRMAVLILILFFFFLLNVCPSILNSIEDFTSLESIRFSQFSSSGTGKATATTTTKIYYFLSINTITQKSN